MPARTPRRSWLAGIAAISGVVPDVDGFWVFIQEGGAFAVSWGVFGVDLDYLFL